MQQENRPLTAIRGLAALWVVAHHAQPGWAPGLGGFAGDAMRLGYVAVDVFFILSGFIMAAVYADITPGQAPGYWWRRVLRVYPLHLCVMAFLALQAIGASLHNPSLPPHPWREFPGVLLLLQSYFSTNDPWNPPTWSVGVELACYAVFPFVMPLLLRAPRSMLILAALLLCGAEWRVLADHAGAILGMGAVLRGLAGFALGAVLSRLAVNLSPARAGIGEAVAFGGIVIGIAWHSPPTMALAAALLIMVLSARSGPLARLLSQGWCVWLGAVSFSIYLLHAPLIGIMDHHLRLPQIGWLRGLALLALLLPLSGLTCRFIEQPGRRLARRRLGWPVRPAAYGSIAVRTTRGSST